MSLLVTKIDAGPVRMMRFACAAIALRHENGHLDTRLLVEEDEHGSATYDGKPIDKGNVMLAMLTLAELWAAERAAKGSCDVRKEALDLVNWLAGVEIERFDPEEIPYADTEDTGEAGAVESNSD